MYLTMVGDQGFEPRSRRALIYSQLRSPMPPIIQFTAQLVKDRLLHYVDIITTFIRYVNRFLWCCFTTTPYWSTPSFSLLRTACVVLHEPD